MKLSKLYCNRKFKQITFNREGGGLNVILADILSDSEESNTHNLGKSLLLDIIDFCLLATLKNDHWLVTTTDSDRTPLFDDYVFYLEIFLNSGKFVTIRRSVSQPTKIAFVESTKTAEGYPLFDLPDKQKNSFTEARKRLDAFLDFDFDRGKPYDYRKSLGYCLRRQGDYDNLFRLDKFVGQHKHWKPFVFDLLGFNGEILREKLEKEDEIKKKKELIDEQQEDYEIDLNEKDKLVGQLQLKIGEKGQIEKELNELNFYEYDVVSIRRANEIEARISILNSELYRLEFEMRKLEGSIQGVPKFDTDSITEVFEQAKIHFPEALVKGYQELSVFNQRITIERNQLLKERIGKCKDEEQKVRAALVSLNDQKKDLRQVIQSESVFEKLKHHQSQLSRIENDLGKFQAKLEAFERIDKRVEELKDLREQAKELGEELRQISNSTLDNLFYMSIRKIFAELVKEILSATAVISISTNSAGNIDFGYEIDREEQVTAQDRGFTYRKLLCIAFDLAILISYRTESYYRFVYHDDVFANEDNRIKQSLLTAIRRICLDNDIQYIFSVIRDELPKDEHGNNIDFKDNEIILRLDDRDDEGKLFRQSF